MTNILGFFFGGHKLACALTDSEQTPHEEKRQQAAALQRAQWTIVLVKGWAAPCSSVFICGFIHPFGCGAHQVNFSKETPCRGRLRFRLTRPLAAGSNLGGSMSWSSLALSSWAHCSGEGFCGEPIFFQTSYELLCSRSIR